MRKRVPLILMLGLGLLGWPGLAHEAGHGQASSAALNQLPAGKMVQTSRSPNKRWQIIIRDEENHGDYFYYAYYFFDGKRYFHLADYVATGKPANISWKPKSVSFQAVSPIGPGQVEVLQIEYLPLSGKLNTRVLRTEAMEMTG